MRPIPASYDPTKHPGQKRWGADGLVWFAKGGSVFVTSNPMIRNYLHEGVQVNAGPAVVQGNTFETPFSSGVACLASADTPNTTRGSTAYILQRFYQFLNNRVTGGAAGVKFGGNSYLAGTGDALSVTAQVVGNTFTIPAAQATLFHTPRACVFASAAETVEIDNNTCTGWERLFYHAAEPQAQYPLLNFFCRNVIIRNNMFTNGREHAIYFQSPMKAGGLAKIGRNTLSRGSSNFHNHIRLGGTNTPLVSGQIQGGVTYRVYERLAANPPVGRVVYQAIPYQHGQHFVGGASAQFSTSAPPQPVPQVRRAAAAPTNYTVQIGQGANLNTFLRSESKVFEYYDPATNSVPGDDAGIPANPGSTQDGVSIQSY